MVVYPESLEIEICWDCLSVFTTERVRLSSLQSMLPKMKTCWVCLSVLPKVKTCWDWLSVLPKVKTLTPLDIFRYAYNAHFNIKIDLTICLLTI